MYIKDEERELIKTIVKMNKGARNINAKILRIIKNEIIDMLEKGLTIIDIQHILKSELKRDFEYRALAAWIQRNIKKNKQKSTNEIDKEEETSEEDSAKKLEELTKKFDIFKK